MTATAIPEGRWEAWGWAGSPASDDLDQGVFRALGLFGLIGLLRLLSRNVEPGHGTDLECSVRHENTKAHGVGGAG
jgi:hypothetical protein